MMHKWENEPDSFVGESNGFSIQMIRNGFGAWCGYVGVDSSHPFYKKDYWHRVACDRDAIRLHENSGIIGTVCEALHEDDGAVALHTLLSVHGGVTYADFGNGKYLDKKHWWFGFDCSHSGDYAPKSSFQNGVYRDFEYAKKETENLAKQLAKYGKAVD